MNKPDNTQKNSFTHVKSFTATTSHARENIGERVTEWIRAENPNIVDTVVAQSSDSAYHCISIIVFFRVNDG